MPGPWTNLMFGWTHEDSAIEVAAFASRARVFCIAAGGCTALRLAAAGHRVTAVDINPAQVEYVRARASGAPMRPGWVEAWMGRARCAFPAIGWTSSRIRRFLEFDAAAPQLDYWQRVLDTRRWRLALRILLAPSLLRLKYADPLVAFLPPAFSAIVRLRLARGFALHPNRGNPYAWRMLAGAAPFDLAPGPRPLDLVCADAAAFLETCPPASFDAFSLSNIIDGAPPGYEARLHHAVRRAAAPGAVMVWRSFVERDGPNCAPGDRSLLWGTVRVEPV